jgi:hypothetical protein
MSVSVLLFILTCLLISMQLYFMFPIYFSFTFPSLLYRYTLLFLFISLLPVHFFIWKWAFGLVTRFPHVEQAAVHTLLTQHSIDMALRAAFSVQSASLIGAEPFISYIQNACC